MKITRRKLRQIIKEEVERAVIKESPDGWKKFEDIEAAKANGWDGPWIDAKGFLNPAPSEKGNLDCTIDDGNFRTSREATFVPTDREFEMLRSDPKKAAWYERYLGWKLHSPQKLVKKLVRVSRASGQRHKVREGCYSAAIYKKWLDTGEDIRTTLGMTTASGFTFLPGEEIPDDYHIEKSQAD
jgi:hypothetical protein